MNYLKLSLAALASILFCNGCADEELLGEKELQRVSVNFNFCERGGVTKSQMPLDDSSIKDMNIYIFNSAGGLIYHRFFTTADVILEDLYIYSGNKYNIYALANWGEERQLFTMEEIMDLNYTPDNQSTLFSAEQGVIMSGKIEDTELYDGQQLELVLKRPVSKVVLRCSKLWLNDGVTVDVTSVTLKNVPSSVVLFKENIAVEVEDGVTYSGSELDNLYGAGVEFYLFENMQGSVSGATTNKGKVNALTSTQRERGSYIEMVCNIVTEDHRGEIKYRFYLGSAMDNCNVERNVEQNIMVAFKGNVSEDENSMSVDNGDLLDRVNKLYTSPSSLRINSLMVKSYQINVIIQPTTAYDKRVEWTSSDTSVATVDANGLMKVVGPGECKIMAKSLDNPSKTAKCYVYIQ